MHPAPSRTRSPRRVRAICSALCRLPSPFGSTTILLGSVPLVAIGGHTITHCNLARQSEEIAREELATGRARIEERLQCPVQHLAYPYGDRAAAGPREFALARQAGFKTAVTTRPGMMFPENAEHPTALPRLSLNGNYQNERLLPVLTSGAATALWNGFRRVDAA